MSKVNGDKSRSNRIRKQNAAKRKRNREMLRHLTAAKTESAGKNKPAAV